MKTMIAHWVQKLVAPAGMRALLGAASVGLLPVAAQAHHHDRDDDRPRVRVDLGRVELGFRRGPVVEVAPACPVDVGPAQVWVEPVYRTVVERVWAPDQFEFRDVCRGRRIFRERVLISPGHFQDVTRQELVTPGHYEPAVAPVP